MNIGKILELLKITDSDNEYVKIAKGRNKYPTNLKEFSKNVKYGAYSNKNKIK